MSLPTPPDVPDAPQSPLPFVPDYRLVRCVGRGAYGEVWLAQGHTGVYRAIKIVQRDRFADEAPFRREFEGLRRALALPVAARLGLLHVGQAPDGGSFHYVMELADDASGGREIDPATYVPMTLREALRRRGRLSPDRVLSLASDLAENLAELHAHGLVHRDLKPANLLFVQGRLRLGDIGLLTTETEAATQVGTPGYVPPEGPGGITADVFAFGRVLYELLTGLEARRFPQLPEEVDRGTGRRLFFRLNELVLRACDPDPRRRPPDAAALLRELRGLSGESARPRWRRLVMPGMGGVVIAAAVVLWLTRAPAPNAIKSPPETAGTGAGSLVEAPADTLAVLPLANQSGDADRDYFADGLTEELINALASDRRLRVHGRASSFLWKGHQRPASEIGRLLGVAHVIEGGVRWEGRRVRVTVQLTRVSDGVTTSLGAFVGELTDVFALQDEIARAVAAKVAGLSPAAPVPVQTRNDQALDAFLRGRVLQARGGTALYEAIACFEQAVALDSDFALAWAHLGAARFRLHTGDTDKRPELVTDARRAIERALVLQPRLAPALVTRAQMARIIDRDLVSARRDLEQAEAIAGPTSASRLIFAAMDVEAGRWDRLPDQARACVAADPADADAANALGLMLAFGGYYAQADELFRRASDLGVGGASAASANRVRLRARWRGAAKALLWLEATETLTRAGAEQRVLWLLALGRTGEARELRRTTDAARALGADAQSSAFSALTLEALGENDLATRRAGEQAESASAELARGNRNPDNRWTYIQAQLVLGQTEAARAVLREWRAEAETLPSDYRRWYGFSNYAVELYVRLGDKAEALALLERAWAGGHRPGYAWRDTSLFAGLRGEPAFEELCRRAEAWADNQPPPGDEPPR